MAPTALFAYEPSTMSATSIAHAVAFVSAIGARTMEVLHVLARERQSAMQDERPEAFRYTDDILDQLESTIRFHLEQPCEEAGVALHVEVVTGEPVHEVLARQQRDGHDYILVGLRNRSRVGKLVFGSKSRELLLTAPCPVLAIPEG